MQHLNLSHRIEEGVPNWILGLTVAACASPAITLNVWPRVVSMLENGWSSNQLGIVLLVTLSALGMTAVPFAMKKAPNRGFWWTSLAFGIGLLLLNYSMAVGAIGKVRDDDAGTKGLIISKANTIKRQIEEARELRKGLPSFRPTSQAMVASAAAAVTLAIQARDQECGRVGDNCRARQAQLSSRQAEFQSLVSDRAFTEERERLDHSIRTYEQGLEKLGPVPTTIDAQASRLAALIGAIPDRVADGLITVLALAAEAFALGMPRIIITAVGKSGQGRPVPTPQPEGAANGRPKPVAEKRPSLSIRPAGPARPTAPIPEWKEAHTLRSQGRIRSWELYQEYSRFAKDQGLEAEKFELFDYTLKQMGVKHQEEAKKNYYLEIASRKPLKAVS